MNLLPPTALITCCYLNSSQTKKRTISALYALQFPKSVNLGVGYRKIKYKWNRIVRLITPEGTLKTVTIDTITKHPTLTTLYKITLDPKKPAVTLAGASLIYTDNGYIPFQEALVNNNLIAIDNYYQHTRNSEIPPIKYYKIISNRVILENTLIDLYSTSLTCAAASQPQPSPFVPT